MAPGSPLLPPQSSPAKKSSQELPFYPIDAQESNHHLSNDITILGGQEPFTATGITTSIIADEMDLDNGTTSQAQAQALALARDIRAQIRTPEPRMLSQPDHGRSNGNGNGNGNGVLHRQDSQAAEAQSPGTPGHIPPFDWDEFQARYEQALADMNGQEKDLLEEFERLVTYFNVWATAASAHDDERAVKRLQTRERYVKIAEQSLVQRKQHLTEVVQAFQSALALLSQT